MTRHHHPDGELVLGNLIEAAHGLDRTWTIRASCVRWAGDDKPTPWQVDNRYRHQLESGEWLKGHEMIRMALMVCATCQAHYDCARYAVNGLMMAGTWAMGIFQLSWLQDRPDALDIIDEAETSGVDMHSMVEMLRAKQKS